MEKSSTQSLKKFPPIPGCPFCMRPAREYTTPHGVRIQCLGECNEGWVMGKDSKTAQFFWRKLILKSYRFKANLPAQAATNGQPGAT
jgi:hypothetical protein